MGKRTFKQRPQRAHQTLDILRRVALLQGQDIRHTRMHEFKQCGGDTSRVCHHRPRCIVFISAGHCERPESCSELKEYFCIVERKFLEVRGGWGGTCKTDAMHKYVSNFFFPRQSRVKPQSHHVELDIARRNTIGYLFDRNAIATDKLRVVRERKNEYLFHSYSISNSSLSAVVSLG